MSNARERLSLGCGHKHCKFSETSEPVLLSISAAIEAARDCDRVARLTFAQILQVLVIYILNTYELTSAQD